MKFIYLIIFLLASLLLTSCEQNNDDNENSNISINNEQEDINSPLGAEENNKTERISYRDYIAKYGENFDQSTENTGNTDELYNHEEELIIPNEDAIIVPANQLSTYSTPLLSSTNERINNIEIVCDRLNNFILNPNESFSYNNVTGPFGPDDGFEEATILLSDGSKSEGYGGGVCQLSSTLYNVVKNIENIEITERHNHSAPVAYVPEGEDATVSLQSGLDFKFTNNNNYSIKFEAECANGNVTVTAFKKS